MSKTSDRQLRVLAECDAAKRRHMNSRTKAFQDLQDYITAFRAEWEQELDPKERDALIDLWALCEDRFELEGATSGA